VSDVEQVRKQAAAEAWTAERIVKDVDRVDMFDSTIRETLAAARESVVPALLAAMRTHPSANARHNAAVLLMQLGDVRGTEGIVALLESGDEDTQISTLAHLGVLPSHDSEYSRAITIDRVRLDRALLPLTAHPDAHIARLASGVMIKFETPSVAEVVAPMLEERDPERREQAARWYASRHDPIALEPIGDMLLRGADSYWLLAALRDYAESKDLRVQERAAGIAATYLRTVLNQDDNSTANDVMNGLRVVERAAPWWESVLLDEVLSSRVMAWARAIALERLAKLEGRVGERRLIAALADRELRKGAADALAKHAGDDATAAAALAAMLDKELRARKPDDRTISAAITALVQRGGASHAVLDRAEKFIDPWDRARITWLRARITPRQIAERLIEAGAVSALADERITALERTWAQTRASGVLFDLLGGEDTCVWLDTEAPVVPPDYVDLVARLGRITRGALAIECATQEATGRGAEIEHIEVQFVEREQAVRFRARFAGDWFDIPATLAALDETLSRAGRPERFFSLHTGDQTCFIVCAKDREFRQLADELRIPYET
jgi:hypothetical protein